MIITLFCFQIEIKIENVHCPHNKCYISCTLLGQHEVIKLYLTNQLTTVLQTLNQSQPLVWREGGPPKYYYLKSSYL